MNNKEIIEKILKEIDEIENNSDHIVTTKEAIQKALAEKETEKWK